PHASYGRNRVPVRVGLGAPEDVNPVLQEIDRYRTRILVLDTYNLCSTAQQRRGYILNSAQPPHAYPLRRFDSIHAIKTLKGVEGEVVKMSSVVHFTWPDCKALIGRRGPRELSKKQRKTIPEIRNIRRRGNKRPTGG